MKYGNTVFLLKIQHANNDTARASLTFYFLEALDLHAPFIAYTHDNLCRKLEIEDV